MVNHIHINVETTIKHIIKHITIYDTIDITWCCKSRQCSRTTTTPRIFLGVCFEPTSQHSCPRTRLDKNTTHAQYYYYMDLGTVQVWRRPRDIFCPFALAVVFVCVYADDERKDGRGDSTFWSWWTYDVQISSRTSTTHEVTRRAGMRVKVIGEAKGGGGVTVRATRHWWEWDAALRVQTRRSHDHTVRLTLQRWRRAWAALPDLVVFIRRRLVGMSGVDDVMTERSESQEEVGTGECSLV